MFVKNFILFIFQFIGLREKVIEKQQIRKKVDGSPKYSNKINCLGVNKFYCIREVYLIFFTLIFLQKK